MIRLQIQSDTKDNAMDIIKTAIFAEIKRLEVGLQKTNKQIEKFENKYKVSSEAFQKKFTAEDMKKGDQEYIEWAGELKIREKILADIKRLKGIEYAAQ